MTILTPMALILETLTVIALGIMLRLRRVDRSDELKNLVVVLAALLLVSLPLISACGGDDGGLTGAEHYDKGVDYFAEGRFDDAIAEFSKAIELDPSFAEAYSNRGNAYLTLGEVQRAIANYAEAIRLNPQDTGAYASRALVYTALGKDRAAERDIEKAVELGIDADLLRAAVEAIKAER